MNTRARLAGASRVVLALGLLALAGFSSMPGCGSDYGGGGSTPPVTQPYTGTVSAGGEGGVVDLTVQTGGQPYPAVTSGGVLPAIVSVSGTLRIVGGSTITLAGTYDTVSRQLHVEDSTMTYVLDGTVSADGTKITGTFTSPAGAGSFVAFSSTGAQILVYCGTFTGTSSGVWNLIRRGGSLLGAFSSNGGNAGLLSGTVEANDAVSLTIESDSGTGSATGTMTTTSASGSWTVDTESGTWSGSTSACGG